MAIAELVVNIVANSADFSRGMQQLDKKLMSSARKATEAGRQLSKLSLPVAAMGGLAAKSAIEFESAFAGVKKTVDGSPEEFAALAQGLKDLSARMPITTTELAGIAEAAGQLGIDKKNILDFTEVMAELGTATNMSSDQAATSLARIANITKLPQTEFRNLGSAIVDLGNNFATTESEITEMSLRLAGAGTQIGLSEADIVGFSAALTSVGINAEAGGTAFSKVFKDMSKAVDDGGKDLDEFAKIAGISSEDFAESFKTKPAEAITGFIEGFKRIKEEGGSAISALDDVGLGSIRVSDALLRTSGAGNLTAEAIELANKAFKEGAALGKEAEQRYLTLASQLSITKNQFNLLLIEMGDRLTPMIVSLNDKVKEAINWFRNLSDENKDLIVKVGLVVAAIGPLVFVMGTMASSFLNIIGAGVQLGSMLKETVRGVGVLAKAVRTQMIPSILAATQASIAFLATPIGLGLLVIVGALVLAYQHWDDLKAIAVGFIEAAGEAWEGFVQWFKDVVGQMPEWVQDSVAFIGELFQKMAEVGTEVVHIIAKEWERLVQQLKEAGQAIVKTWEWVTGQVSSGTVKITTKQQAWINKAKEAGKTVAEYKRGIDALKSSTDKATKAVTENTKATTNQITTTGKKTKADKDTESQLKKTSAAQNKANKEAADFGDLLTNRLGDATNDYINDLIDMGVHSRDSLTLSADKVQELTDQYVKLGRLSIPEAKKALKEFIDLNEKGIDKALQAESFSSFGQLFNSKVFGGQSDGIGATLATVMDDAINQALGAIVNSEGELANPEHTAKAEAVGAGVGTAIGAYFGSPQLGAMIGGGIGRAIGSWTGGNRNLAANLRDDLSDFFNEALKDLQFKSDILIDGRFKLPMGRNAFDLIQNDLEEFTTAATSTLQALDIPPEIFANYENLGYAMAASIGQGDEALDQVIGQFGTLLAINFQNIEGLNEIQILLMNSGLTAEQMGEALKIAWLEGDLSAKQFISATQQVTEIFTQGIPNALGATDIAFRNLVKGGLQSGMKAFDSLGDIGAEAIEKGITSLARLRDDLILSGANVEDVDKFMQALAANGITSVEQLAGVTELQSAGIISSLEDVAFGFEDVQTSVQELKKDLDDIKSKEIDVKINVKTNFDSQLAKDAFGNGVQITPSALGNVFSNGAVQQFAKGGVISKMTAFDIGTMAEQGPEAIMPLERTRDGRLGVVSAASSGGETIIVNVDARGAEIGAASRIRREIENYLDRRNNSNGRR